MSTSLREKSNANLTKQSDAAKQEVDDVLITKIDSLETLLKERLKNPIGDLSKCTTITKILAYVNEALSLEDISNKRSSLYEKYRSDLKERFQLLANEVKAINANLQGTSEINEEDLEAELAERTKELQSKVSGLAGDVYRYQIECTELKSSLTNVQNQLDNERKTVKALREQLAKEQSKTNNIIKIGDK